MMMMMMRDHERGFLLSKESFSIRGVLKVSLAAFLEVHKLAPVRRAPRRRNVVLKRRLNTHKKGRRSAVALAPI